MLAPLIISHAACKGHAPENTLAGIQAALAFGVDAIEIDVHATRDGVPVLMHDATVDRTTDGSGRVYDLPLAQIEQLDAGGSASDGRFRGERVPTLAAALDLTRHRCLLVVEIKQRGIEQAVVNAVRYAGAAQSVMIWSFYPEVVSAAREVAPEIAVAQLSGPLSGEPAPFLGAAVRRNAQAVSVFAESVNAGLVRAARLRGLSVFAWTVDEPDEQARAAAAGVAGIVSNVPDLLRATLKRARYEMAGHAPKQVRARRKTGAAISA